MQPCMSTQNFKTCACHPEPRRRRGISRPRVTPRLLWGMILSKREVPHFVRDDRLFDRRMVIDHGKNTIRTLNKCRAALDPVAAVVICDVAELADGCAMNVATEDGIHTVALRVMRHSGFEFANKAYCIFHTALGISADRPVAEAEAAPDDLADRALRRQKFLTNAGGHRMRS